MRRVIANNPSKYTYLGTGTYIVGHGDVAVIDPGPVLDEHRDALRRCARRRSSAGDPRDALPLRSLAAGRVAARRDRRADDRLRPARQRRDDGSTTRSTTRSNDGVTLEETTDTDFEPDVRVGDGEVAAMGAGWTMRAVYTPGHTSNHMCYALDEEQALFTGDHVMGWSTTVVSPPDGDMRAYIDSLRKVMGRDDAVAVADPRCSGDSTASRSSGVSRASARTRSAGARCRAVGPLRHRGDGQASCTPTCARSCTRPPARSVLSHLIKLVDDGMVTVEGKGRDCAVLPDADDVGDERQAILVEDARLGDPVEGFLDCRRPATRRCRRPRRCRRRSPVAAWRGRRSGRRSRWPAPG